MPSISAPAKVDRIKSYGADVIQQGANYAESLALCDAHIAKTGAVSVHAYNAEPTLAGQGTLGQLMVNPQLYESLNGATYEMHEFLKEFRKDPRKYLRIKASIFSGKTMILKLSNLSFSINLLSVRVIYFLLFLDSLFWLLELLRRSLVNFKLILTYQ